MKIDNEFTTERVVQKLGLFKRMYLEQQCIVTEVLSYLNSGKKCEFTQPQINFQAEYSWLEFSVFFS